MESDELPCFPSAAYALANLRRYCEALELDYSALVPLARIQLATLPSQPLHARVLLTPPSPGPSLEMERRSGAAGSLVAAVALAVFLGASALTAMHIASVPPPGQPAPAIAQPLPAYAEWQHQPLIAGPTGLARQ